MTKQYDDGWIEHPKAFEVIDAPGQKKETSRAKLDRANRGSTPIKLKNENDIVLTDEERGGMSLAEFNALSARARLTFHNKALEARRRAGLL